MKYWIFSVVTALLAYSAGSLKSSVLASNFVFHKNLRRLGSGNVLISNFRRIYGWKGVVKITLTELVLDLFASTIWPGHTYGRSISGTVQSVTALSRAFISVRPMAARSAASSGSAKRCSMFRILPVSAFSAPSMPICPMASQRRVASRRTARSCITTG